MDFQSAMETFAEAWVAANAGQQVRPRISDSCLLAVNHASLSCFRNFGA